MEHNVPYEMTKYLINRIKYLIVIKVSLINTNLVITKFFYLYFTIIYIGILQLMKMCYRLIDAI